MRYSSNIPAINSTIVGNQQKALKAVGIFVQGEAKSKASVDTGNLRGSITHAVGSDRVRIGTNALYAIYVEKGTGKYVAGGRKTPWYYRNRQGKLIKTEGQRPQPYLTPAVEGNVSRIQQLVSQMMGQGLR